jgi:ribosomal protein S18 acetylase RimI-like enzyme
MEETRQFHTVELIDDYRLWARELLEEKWGSVKIITRGRIHDAMSLPGFVAILNGDPVGLVTYRIFDNECEVITLSSVEAGIGAGTTLLKMVKETAITANCNRIWLITTNDNVDAMRFYQRRGFKFAALYINALEESRRLKPELSLTGLYGIPLRDEIELEMALKVED